MGQLLTDGWPNTSANSGSAPSGLAGLREPRGVEAAVLAWLIKRNHSTRPPVMMAKLLTFMAVLHQRGLPFDRRAVAEALGFNLYTQDTALRTALDYGHLTHVYYVPSPELCAIIEAARASLM